MTHDTLSHTDQFVQDWQQWHDQLDERRALPHGFLAYTSFNVLSEQPQRFEDLPGEWVTGPEGPIVVLAEGETLEVDGRATTGVHHWGVIGERTFHRASFGDALVEVSKRGGYDIVRPLHPDHPLRLQFTGTPAYAPQERWVIAATFEPDEADLTIQAALAPVVHQHESPGRVRFEFEGEQYALTLIRRSPTLATALFRDSTSGVTTYAASRTLAVELPADGSTDVVLDFNRAQNLQCAYTNYSPCPLAPPENHLPFAVEAGEKIPHEKSHAHD